MKLSRKLFGQLAELILEGGAKKATKFLSADLVLKATLQGKSRKSDRSKTVLFTVGKPNYAEREFIAKCKEAGEPFPVKKVQLKWPIAAMFLLMFSMPAFGQQQIRMQWDASATPNVTYLVYRGKAVGDCVQMTADCTKLTATPITGLTYTDTMPATGGVYVVRAVDSLGLVSGPSNEMVLLPPSPASNLRKTP